MATCLISPFPFVRQRLPSVPFNSGLAEGLVHYDEDKHIALLCCVYWGVQEQSFVYGLGKVFAIYI